MSETPAPQPPPDAGGGDADDASNSVLSSCRDTQSSVLVSVIMGSTSDWETMRHADETLDTVRRAARMPRRFGASHAGPDGGVRGAARRSAASRSSSRARAARRICRGWSRRKRSCRCSACRSRATPSRGWIRCSRSCRCRAACRSGRWRLDGRARSMRRLLAIAILATTRPALREQLRHVPGGAGGAGAGGDAAVSAPILPGATIGVLGSGQLGRMLALAARRMGYRIHTFSPERDTPTGQVADREITAAYDDLDAVRAFAAGVRGRHARVREYPDRDRRGDRRVRPGAARRRGAAHDATSHPREDVPARRGLPRHAVPPRGNDGRTAGGAGGIRLPRRAEDRRFRLRRQGAGENQRAGGGGRRLRRLRRARGDPGSVRAFRARGLRRRGARTGWRVRALRRRREHPRDHILDTTVAPADCAAGDSAARQSRSRAGCWTRSVSSAWRASSSS